MGGADTPAHAAVATVSERLGNSAVPCKLTISLVNAPSVLAAAAAYFVVSETLTNVAKHAHASTMHITVSCADGELMIEVHEQRDQRRDNGGRRVWPARADGLRRRARRAAEYQQPSRARHDRAR